jgi:hypothetical protein
MPICIVQRHARGTAAMFEYSEVSNVSSVVFDSHKTCFDLAIHSDNVTFATPGR